MRDDFKGVMGIEVKILMKVSCVFIIFFCLCYEFAVIIVAFLCTQDLYTVYNIFC